MHTYRPRPRPHALSAHLHIHAPHPRHPPTTCRWAADGGRVRGAAGVAAERPTRRTPRRRRANGARAGGVARAARAQGMRAGAWGAGWGMRAAGAWAAACCECLLMNAWAAACCSGAPPARRRARDGPLARAPCGLRPPQPISSSSHRAASLARCGCVAWPRRRIGRLRAAPPPSIALGCAGVPRVQERHLLARRRVPLPARWRAGRRQRRRRRLRRPPLRSRRGGVCARRARAVAHSLSFFARARACVARAAASARAACLSPPPPSRVPRQYGNGRGRYDERRYDDDDDDRRNDEPIRGEGGDGIEASGD